MNFHRVGSRPKSSANVGRIPSTNHVPLLEKLRVRMGQHRAVNSLRTGRILMMIEVTGSRVDPIQIPAALDERPT